MAKASPTQAEVALAAQQLVSRLEYIQSALNHRLEQLVAATLVAGVPGMTYHRAIQEIRSDLATAQAEYDEEGVLL
jgi:hypothetical protein